MKCKCEISCSLWDTRNNSKWYLSLIILLYSNYNQLLASYYKSLTLSTHNHNLSLPFDKIHKTVPKAQWVKQWARYFKNAHKCIHLIPSLPLLFSFSWLITMFANKRSLCVKTMGLLQEALSFSSSISTSAVQVILNENDA